MMKDNWITREIEDHWLIFLCNFKIENGFDPNVPELLKVHSINAKANLPILWEKLFCTGGLSKYYRAEKLVKLLQCKGL